MRLALRLIPILIILSLNIACGMGQHTRDESLTELSAPTIIKKIWTTDAGRGTNNLFIGLTLSLTDKYLYVANTDGVVKALRTENGKTVWQKDLDLPLTGGPSVDKKRLLVGSHEGDVISLSADTGEELWRAKVSSEILAAPAITTVIAIRTIDGKIFALDSVSGQRLWVYDRDTPALTLRGTSAPVIANQYVIAGFDDGRIAVLELETGKVVWEQRVAIARGRNGIERIIDIDSTPLVIDNIIYLAAFQNEVMALSLDSGKMLWRRRISVYNNMAADENYLYLSDENDRIFALDRYTGDTFWEQKILEKRGVTGPDLLKNKVIIGDKEGYLHWLDKATGELAARVRVKDSPIHAKIVAANRVIFVQAEDGTLAAYSAVDKATDPAH